MSGISIAPGHRLPPSPPSSPKPSSVPAAPAISAIDRLVGIVGLLKSGKLPYTADWKVVNLSHVQFAKFERRVGADEALCGFYHDKVRYDYDPRQGEFILRVPTTLHERFNRLVENAISDAIQHLARDLRHRHGENAANTLQEIYQGGSPTLYLHAPKLENSSQSSFSSSDEDTVLSKCPDATFFHRHDNALPALVLEVSYSQQRKDLPSLAESYIVDSRHHIRCVVGLDITYRGKSKDRSASISIWRPGVEQDEDGEDVGICRCDADAVLFQNTHGEACDGEMKLNVTDLLPVSILEKLPESAQHECINISFERLRAFLHDAEIKQVPNRSKNTQQRFRKKKRTRSEQLSHDREAFYLKQEETELEKERKADGEWKGPGSDRSNEERDVREGAGADVVVGRSKRNKQEGARTGAGDEP